MASAARCAKVAIPYVFTYPHGDFLLGRRETDTLPRCIPISKRWKKRFPAG
jgi:hypothetical protein